MKTSPFWMVVVRGRCWRKGVGWWRDRLEIESGTFGIDDAGIGYGYPISSIMFSISVLSHHQRYRSFESYRGNRYKV
jgi:hypothetical protein